MKLNIAIADDHPIYRDGFKTFLDTLEIVREAFACSNGVEIVELLKERPIHLVFMDVNMPIKDGIEATREIKKLKPAVKIVAISSYDNLEYIDKMLQAGVDGYILKDAGYEEISQAIDKTIAGVNYFSPRILSKLSKRVFHPNGNNGHISMSEITKREEEVLKLLCQGFNRHEIAEKLFISEKTVDKHRENLITKTDSKNSIGLVLFAIKNGLVQL